MKRGATHIVGPRINTTCWGRRVHTSHYFTRFRREMKAKTPLLNWATVSMIHLMIYTGVIDVSDAEHERKRRIPRYEHTPFCRGLQSFATKVLPFRQERSAARTGMTCKTSAILCETGSCFLGKGMVPKSQKRQTFLTTHFCKAEQFTLNWRQRYDSMSAIVPDKAQERRSMRIS
jgi:hypothetical protein